MVYFDPSRDIRILHNQQCMSNNAMNDTVMKAHQNRDMTYDEMNDYEMSMRRRTLREATYCLYMVS